MAGIHWRIRNNLRALCNNRSNNKFKITVFREAIKNKRCIFLRSIFKCKISSILYFISADFIINFPINKFPVTTWIKIKIKASSNNQIVSTFFRTKFSMLAIYFYICIFKLFKFWSNKYIIDFFRSFMVIL